MTQIYSKDSFDRFGDDLCEKIIGFLDFDKKVEFECVSKQWKRTIYQEQNQLIFIIDREFKMKIFTENSKTVGIRDLTSLLRKCPNITYFSIRILGYPPGDFRCEMSYLMVIGDYVKEVFRLISSIEHKIRSISVPFFLVPEEDNQQFINIFGSNLKSFHLKYEENYNKNCLKTVPNIRRANFEHTNDLKLMVDNQGNCLFNKLTHMAPPPIRGNDRNIIKHLLDCNQRVQYIRFYANFRNSNLLVYLFTEVSKLRELRALELKIFKCNNPERVYQSFGNIGKNCPKLTKLFIHEELPQQLCCNKSFDSLQHFPNLIHLNVLYFWVICVPQNYYSEISCKSLAKCHNLRRLKLQLPGLKDQFFVDCDKHISKLNYLTIHESNITDVSLDWISRLTNLRSLEILSLYPKREIKRIGEKSILKVFNNCPKLQSIYLRYERNITDYIRERDGISQKKYGNYY